MSNLSRGKGLFIFPALYALILLIPTPIAANSLLDVIINEICWTGTDDSYNDEWIELYNNTDSLINLSGWSLKATDGTPEIYLNGTISQKSFYLLERTDDNAVQNISADQIYTGSLGNKGEDLFLYDSSGNIIDFVNCGAGWFAGDNEKKLTMERKNSRSAGNSPENWQNSQESGGTPKNKNSEFLKQEETLVENSGLIEEKAGVIYPGKIVFNEILPSPEGPDEENEWIEIFNQNNFDVNISGWQITDIIGTTKIYNFPGGTIIKANDFLIIPRTETKIVLNNDNDGVKLIKPDGKTEDEINYTNAPQPQPAQSYNRTISEWAWSETLTPGKNNIISTETAQEITPNIENSGDINSGEQEKEPFLSNRLSPSASIKDKLPQEKSFFPIAVLSFFLAVFSGAAIFFLKRCCNKKKIC
jgi:hypothetical protein